MSAGGKGRDSRINRPNYSISSWEECAPLLSESFFLAPPRECYTIAALPLLHRFWCSPWKAVPRVFHPFVFGWGKNTPHCSTSHGCWSLFRHFWNALTLGKSASLVLGFLVYNMWIIQLGLCEVPSRSFQVRAHSSCSSWRLVFSLPIWYELAEISLI